MYGKLPGGAWSSGVYVRGQELETQFWKSRVVNVGSSGGGGGGGNSGSTSSSSRVRERMRLTSEWGEEPCGIPIFKGQKQKEESVKERKDEDEQKGKKRTRREKKWF